MMDQPSTPGAIPKVPQIPTSTPPVLPQLHISQDDNPTPKSLTADRRGCLTTDAKNRSFLQMNLQKTTQWQSPTPQG